MAGYCFSRSTASAIFCTTCAAAAGLSRAIYSASAVKFAKAVRSHLTRTVCPFLQRPFYFLIGSEVPPIGLCHSLLNFLDLPIV